MCSSDLSTLSRPLASTKRLLTTTNSPWRKTRSPACVELRTAVGPSTKSDSIHHLHSCTNRMAAFPLSPPPHPTQGFQTSIPTTHHHPVILPPVFTVGKRTQAHLHCSHPFDILAVGWVRCVRLSTAWRACICSRM